MAKKTLVGNALASGSGRNGAGACTVVAAVVGDAILSVIGVSGAEGANDKTASFETVVTINGQVQQTDAADLSTSSFMFLVRR